MSFAVVYSFYPVSTVDSSGSCIERTQGLSAEPKIGIHPLPRGEETREPDAAQPDHPLAVFYLSYKRYFSHKIIVCVNL